MSEPPALYLVDTSVWIPALRRRGDAVLRRRVDALLAADQVGTTSMVRLELLASATETEAATLEPLLDSLHQLPTDEAVWTEAARIGRALRRAGRAVPNTDLLIAAVALRHDALLIHRDADYEVIAHHAGLKTASHL